MTDDTTADDGDCGGDSYWSFILPSGNTLVISTCPRSYWDENAEAQHLGDDFGYFMFEHYKLAPRMAPQILAKFASVEEATVIAEVLERLLPPGN